jgi:hypothetical protein
VPTRYNKKKRGQQEDEQPAITPMKRSAIEQPDEPKRPLKRCNAVMDISKEVKQASEMEKLGSLKQGNCTMDNWTNQMLCLSAANSQLLTRAIEQNTLALKEFNALGLRELILKLNEKFEKNNKEDC